MADVKQITFSHREIVEILLKDQQMTEGIWGLYLEFGLQGANLSIMPDSKDLMPAAVIPVVRIGLQRMDEESSIAVDAAKLSPPKKAARKKARK